jgi:hypothetical protein
VHFHEGYTQLFTFRKDVFMPGESSVEVQPYILDVFCLGDLSLVYVDWGTCFSMRGQCDANGFRFIGFNSPFCKPILYY